LTRDGVVHVNASENTMATHPADFSATLKFPLPVRPEVASSQSFSPPSCSREGLKDIT
jgi:hypothetical protein